MISYLSKEDIMTDQREYMKKWRADHAEELKAARKANYAANREAEIAKVIEWRKRNPLTRILLSKIRFANARYPGKLTVAGLRSVLERCGERCHWCGKEPLIGTDLTIDHVKPINDPDCIVIACSACNVAQAAKYGYRRPPEEIAAGQAAYKKKWEADNKPRLDEKRKAWVEANREKLREYHREYYQRNKK